MINYETINIYKLKQLDTYKLPKTYELQDILISAHRGIIHVPPGYPDFFIQKIHPESGGEVRKGSPNRVISYGGHLYVVGTNLGYDLSYFKREEVKAKNVIALRDIYKSLPIDHPRTVAWLHHLYSNYRSKYFIPGNNIETKEVNPEIKLFAEWDNTNQEYQFKYSLDIRKYKGYEIDPKYQNMSKEWLEITCKEVELYNRDLNNIVAKYVNPSNMVATRYVREFYPDFTPSQEFLDNIPEFGGIWWTLLDHQPTPETCRSFANSYAERIHPQRIRKEDKHCLWCGHEIVKVEAVR